MELRIDLTEEIKEPRYPGNNINGWMLDIELWWLYVAASQMKNVLEVGSWMGRSTHALLSGCKGTVYAVDHFRGSPSEIDHAHVLAKTHDIYEIFLENVGHFKNLSTLKMDSVVASRLFGDKYLDMVFIDGDHFYEPFRRDIEAWMPKCRKLLCGHDVSQSGVPHVLNDLGLKYYQPIGSIWAIDMENL